MNNYQINDKIYRFAYDHALYHSILDDVKYDLHKYSRTFNTNMSVLKSYYQHRFFILSYELK